MKILLDNKVIDSTITSNLQNENYPAQNLANQFLRKRYQAVGITDLITITFDLSISTTSFYYSYNNLSSMVVRFYDFYDLLLHTENITEVFEEDAIYFTQVDDVSYMTIEVTTSFSDAYLGGVAVGIPTDFGNVFAAWEDDPLDNSVVTDSDSGQSLQNYEEPLSSYNFEFRDKTNAEKLTEQNLIKAKGKGGKIWADPFEDNHVYMVPFYGTIRSMIVPVKNGRRFDYTLRLREAR